MFNDDLRHPIAVRGLIEAAIVIRYDNDDEYRDKWSILGLYDVLSVEGVFSAKVVQIENHDYYSPYDGQDISITFQVTFASGDVAWYRLERRFSSYDEDLSGKMTEVRPKLSSVTDWDEV